MVVHAISNKYDRKVVRIQTPIELENVFTGAKIYCEGIWDTGATNSAITEEAARNLGLTTLKMTEVRGVHGIKKVNVYQVGITLNNKNISVKEIVTECSSLSKDGSVGMLIGMNIITMGDFAITHSDGKTLFSFQVPSTHCIDFV